MYVCTVLLQYVYDPNGPPWQRSFVCHWFGSRSKDVTNGLDSPLKKSIVKFYCSSVQYSTTVPSDSVAQRWRTCSTHRWSTLRFLHNNTTRDRLPSCGIAGCPVNKGHRCCWRLTTCIILCLLVIPRNHKVPPPWSSPPALWPCAWLRPLRLCRPSWVSVGWVLSSLILSLNWRASVVLLHSILVQFRPR